MRGPLSYQAGQYVLRIVCVYAVSFAFVVRTIKLEEISTRIRKDLRTGEQLLLQLLALLRMSCCSSFSLFKLWIMS